MKVAKHVFARIIGKSLTMVDNYVAQQMPGYTASPKRGTEAEIDLELAIPWLLSKAKLQDSRRELDEARTRLADEQQRKIALEVRKLKTELVEVSLVELVWTRLVGAFRARILAMPSKLAPRLRAIGEINVIRDKIEAEALQALEELSDEGALRSIADANSWDRSGGNTATKTNGKRVGGREQTPIA